MRRFNRVGATHFEPVWIEGGPKSRAILQRPPDIDRPGQEFAYPSPTLRVPPNSLVKSGQVIRTQAGMRYLVADHSATVDWVTHHLFNCDRQVDWATQTVTKDPVTGLEKVRGTTDPVQIWVMWEKVRREFTDLNIRVNQETHLMLTGEDVKMNDLINGLKVVRVNRALGVNVVEIQA